MATTLYIYCDSTGKEMGFAEAPTLEEALKKADGQVEAIAEFTEGYYGPTFHLFDAVAEKRYVCRNGQWLEDPS